MVHSMNAWPTYLLYKTNNLTQPKSSHEQVSLMQNEAGITNKVASEYSKKEKESWSSKFITKKRNKTPFVSLSWDILTYSENDISAKNEETILFYVSGHFPFPFL